MLTIEVVAIQGTPPPVPISARFGTDGGSIGRDSACTLVLPDVEKRISRRHAQIVWRDGQFRLRNQGSAIAVMVNGTPLDYGADIELASGDRVDIGEFALQIHGEPVGQANVATRTDSSTRRAAPPAADDILAGFGPSSSASDPFADLIPNPVSARPPPTPAARGVSTAPAVKSPPVSGQLPDDFDPFGEPAPAPAPSPAARTGGGRGDFSDLVPAQTEGVDELFGLRGGDPFPPNHPLAAPSASSTPGPVGIDDLLHPGVTPQAAPARGSFIPTQRDDASELSAQVRLPQSAPYTPIENRTPPPALDPVEGEATTTAGMMLSWDEAGDGRVFDGTRTLVIRGESAERRRGERRQSVAAVAVAPPPPEPVIPAASPPSNANDADLVRALLDGLGLERWPDPNGVDAEAMRRIGKLMRAAVQGTIDLLRARATIKSEVQAQMTMIVTRDNNPLKFSPNVEAALAHLLGPAQRGFMSAPAAMDDAYRDLVAHQFGFTAGTRAALADVLRRFDPATLEQRLVTKSMLDSLLPANHKAKLWNLFTERFAQMSNEAEEDFQRLFGKEFVRAYEAQVAKMNLPGHKEKE